MTKPKIILVDDEPEDARVLVKDIEKEAVLLVRHPDEVDPGDLVGTHLVLVDLKLDGWIEERAKAPLCMQPLDGLAVATILRAHAELEPEIAAPIAFAVLTGDPGSIAGGLPPEYREHIISYAHNLEWLFLKKSADLSPRILRLAQAIADLPKKWPQNDAAKIEEQLSNQLKIPVRERWHPLALEEALACNPPIHDLSLFIHGLAFARWMLHKILPYPAFLWDDWRLATRLRISRDLLGELLTERTALSELLARAQYQGLLYDFLGARWFRSGIESLLWEISAGKSFDVEVVHQALEKLADHPIEKAIQQHPVICLDSTFRPSTLAEIEDAVRIQPDDWPKYAEEAWTSLELALASPRLQAVVIRSDRDKLLSQVEEDS